MKELRGRVAVITGAGSGIGAGLARTCAAAGMRLALADVESNSVEHVAAEVRAGGGEAFAMPVDVRDAKAVASFADRTWDAYGACHVLFNNAGVVLYRPAAELELADWRWVLSVNLDGVIHGLHAFLPRMRAQGGPAHIVNTASMAGLMPMRGAGLAAYAASKYAVVAISETLRLELEPEGIGVTVVCPGGVQTRINESERNRPSELRQASAAPPPDLDRLRETSQGLERRDNWLTPEQAAERILAAVRENELYAITHPEWLPHVRERHAALEGAFERAAARER
jgi:NAD(P)-dependent dehydrogenase (short-subunit alcohol dehydrogenase family)